MEPVDRAVLGFGLSVIAFILVVILIDGENKQECRLAAIEKNYAAVEAIAICGGLK